MSSELKKAGITSLYYMMGLTECGMIDTLNVKQKKIVSKLMHGNKLLNPADVCCRIVDSLYKGSVANTKDYPCENALQVRRDGYAV